MRTEEERRERVHTEPIYVVMQIVVQLGLLLLALAFLLGAFGLVLMVLKWIGGMW